MRKFLVFMGLLLGLQWMPAQAPEPTQRYFVFFKDKDVSCDPTADFVPEALARRQRMGIPFPTVEDYPLTPAYTEAVKQAVTATRHPLRWFNALTVEATTAQIEAVKQLPFVVSVQPFEPLEVVLAEEETYLASDTARLSKLFDNQRELVHLQEFENNSLSGKGLMIAVFDAGFSGADAHVALAHLRAGGQIRATQDFVTKGGNVYGHSKHGTAVLSCIAGMYEGQRLGAATSASFLLARTERNLREPKSEEDNWMAAMEWADQNGADIISSSLGYAKPRYDYEDMTGSKTLVSQAAAMGVRKGMLVVNSAGNEGGGKFHYIAAPADADSVLTVGASYPMMAYRMPFSSFGPNARGLTKPEICGPGYMLAAHKSGDYRPFAGTSFACPNVAGMAACIMERWPQETNMQIRQRIIEAGSTYPYYDFAIGYGVLDAAKVLREGSEPAQPTFTVEERGDTLWVSMDRAALVLDSAKYKSGKPFSFRTVLPDGQLGTYKTILLSQKNVRFGLPPLGKGRRELWFQGYMWREE